jgi:hypothetical protein
MFDRTICISKGKILFQGLNGTKGNNSGNAIENTNSGNAIENTSSTTMSPTDGVDSVSTTDNSATSSPSSSTASVGETQSPQTSTASVGEKKKEGKEGDKKSSGDDKKTGDKKATGESDKDKNDKGVAYTNPFDSRTGRKSKKGAPEGCPDDDTTVDRILEDCGKPYPKHYNPSDWLLLLVRIEIKY